MCRKVLNNVLLFDMLLMLILFFHYVVKFIWKTSQLNLSSYHKLYTKNDESIVNVKNEQATQFHACKM